MRIESAIHGIDRALVTAAHGSGGREIEQAPIEPPAKPTDAGGLISVDMIGKTVTARTFDPFPREVTESQQMIKRDKSETSLATKLLDEVWSAPGEVRGNGTNCCARGGSDENHEMIAVSIMDSRPRPGMAQRRFS